MATRPTKLVNAGLDGFAVIDEYYRKQGPVPKKQAEITSQKAAEKYGGIVFTDYPKVEITTKGKNRYVRHQF
uniref:Uncharacterized protein n=1 Tax=Fagus sylvatica TaxID=28930 RepID=A0A2N9G234_FAGSY